MEDMGKYTLVTISGIHATISEKTEVPGYTIGVIQTFMPSDEEISAWTAKERNLWICKNNKRMKAVCKFLNKENL